MTDKIIPCFICLPTPTKHVYFPFHLASHRIVPQLILQYRMLYHVCLNVDSLHMYHIYSYIQSHLSMPFPHLDALQGQHDFWSNSESRKTKFRKSLLNDASPGRIDGIERFMLTCTYMHQDCQGVTQSVKVAPNTTNMTKLRQESEKRCRGILILPCHVGKSKNTLSAHGSH